MIPQRSRSSSTEGFPRIRAGQQPTQQAAASRGAQVLPPRNLQRPCLWIVSLGTPAQQLPELKAHYETQAEALGYSVGYIDTVDDAEALLTAIQRNMKNDTVLLLNTDAGAPTVAAVQDHLRPRSQIRQVGSADGSATDPRDLAAWQALQGLPPVANAGADVWTVAQLESALSGLNESGVVGATPPRGSRIQDDLDRIVLRYKAVAQGIQRMKEAGRLQNLSPELATRLAAFEITLARKLAASAKRSDANASLSG